MEGDAGQRLALGPDCTPHKNELQLVNFDMSGEQASPTCPLNLLVPSNCDLDLSDPFLSGCGGGGDRAQRPSGHAVPTDELVDFREKGSREADGSDRGDDSDLQLIGDDALGLSGEVDMDNIFQEALALADQFSALDPQDDADISLLDSAPKSLPGESDLFSLDATLLAALAESRRELPPYRPRGPRVAQLDSSFPLPAATTPGPSAPGTGAARGVFSVSSLLSSSAAAVSQAANSGSSAPTPAGVGVVPGVSPSPVSSSLPGAALGGARGAPSGIPAQTASPARSSGTNPAPSSAAAAHSSPRPAPPAVGQPEAVPAASAPAASGPAASAPAASAPAASAPAPSAPAPSSPAPPVAAVTASTPLTSPRCDSPAVAVPPGRRDASPASPPSPVGRRREASPPAAGGSAYADLYQQASAEQRELERQADEEYENREFEQMERRVSRAERSAPVAEKPHPRSQLSRKETYICRPNTGTFKIDKKQRFGTFKVDKTGTFKVPRSAASAARSLPPEPDDGVNGGPETGSEQGSEDPLAATPGSSVNGEYGPPSVDAMNTYCQDGDDELGERSPSPPRRLLSASSPEEGEARAAPRRPAALRRPLTSTPCRSAGSSGSSIGVTPIRAPPDALDGVQDSPAPAAALRAAALRQSAEAGLRQPAEAGLRQPAEAGLRQPVGAGLRQPVGAGLRQPAGAGLRQPTAVRKPAASALRQPAASGLKQPAASALRQPAASGLRQPGASGLRQPAASGLRQPAASGLRQPAASGLRQPAASGLRAPAASGLRPPSAAGLRAPAAAPRSAPARQTAAQLRQSSAQSGSDSSVCSVRSLPGPNTSRSNPSLVSDRSEYETSAPRLPRHLPGPSSRLPARSAAVRRSAGGTGSLTNISLQASHVGGVARRTATARKRCQETSKLSLSQQPAGSERF